MSENITIDTSETEAIFSAAVDRLHRSALGKSRDDLAEAMRRTIVRRIGHHVPVNVGVSLKTVYTGDGQGPRSLIVDAVDADGFLTITRDARWYNPYGTASEQASPMSKPLGQVHRDLIVPPPFAVADSCAYSSSEETYSMGGAPAGVYTRGCHDELSSAAKDDERYGREDAEEFAAEVFGAPVSEKLANAINDEADRAVREAMADSPANGAGPVKLLIVGVSGRPVQCVLTDIELPYATATIRTSQGKESARVNLYTRCAFAEASHWGEPAEREEQGGGGGLFDFWDADEDEADCA